MLKDKRLYRRPLHGGMGPSGLVPQAVSHDAEDHREQRTEGHSVRCFEHLLLSPQFSEDLGLALLAARPGWAKQGGIDNIGTLHNYAPLLRVCVISR